MIKRDWSTIVNTINISQGLNNLVSITYYNEGKQTAIGKITNIDNSDQKLTLKHKHDFWVLQFQNIIDASVIAS
ncbi:YolD-like family protein [Geomicrobium sp. JCM 19055]|uniref:YolD-like family protein n=1 Tax=Geomicrobium sp. JCM 19055 TaxID=1460649 RepID=UPI0005AB61C1|nr:YolD-like family protein [Geomicrobium sp. JCM 19055]